MPEQLPPHAQVLQHILNGWISQAVSAFATLGVADHIDQHPKSAEEIAPEVGARPDLLYRLMRTMASVGILHETTGRRFTETPLTDCLRTNAAPSFRDIAAFCADEWHVRGWGELAKTIQTGERPLERIWGLPAFQYLEKYPEQGATFHRGMTNMSSLDGPAVADAYDFTGIESLTDVGGGHGLLLSTILQRYPAMKGTLYDQPSVVAGAAGGPTEPVKDRVTMVSGDMFSSVPAGADAYIMKYIIHDWPDDLCVKILKGCREGVNEGGKLLVVDSVVPGPNEFHPGKVSDLEMMLFPGGKERTTEEFRDLFSDAGWKLSRIVPTVSHVSVVEGVPA